MEISPITLCGKTCDFEGKYVVFATPVSQKRRRRPIHFILDSLSAPMKVPYTKFSVNSMKNLNHNASILRDVLNHSNWNMKVCGFILQIFSLSIHPPIGAHLSIVNAGTPLTRCRLPTATGTWKYAKVLSSETKAKKRSCYDTHVLTPINIMKIMNRPAELMVNKSHCLGIKTPRHGYESKVGCYVIPIWMISRGNSYNNLKS